MEGRIEAAAALHGEAGQHATEHGANRQARPEAALTEEAGLTSKATKAAGDAAEVLREAAKARESSGTEARAGAGARHHTLLESGLIRIGRTEPTAGLQSLLEASLVGVHGAAEAAGSHALLKAGLETGLERVLSGKAKLTGHAATEAELLTHLSDLVAEFLDLARHHALLEPCLVGILGTELARESGLSEGARSTEARLLHGEVVELLAVLTALFLFAPEQFTEQ